MNFKKRVNGSWTDTPHYIHNTSTDTITTLPADIYPNDATATVGLKGNMQQSGTPTPTNPIQPQECGEIATNILSVYKENYSINANGEETYNAVAMIYKAEVGVSDSTFTLTFGGLSAGDVIRIHAYTGDTWQSQIASINITQVPLTFTVASNIDNIRVSIRKTATDVTMTDGQYKIPILNNSQTTNVYLGEVQTTRRIRKLVLTGEENWRKNSNGSTAYISPVVPEAMWVHALKMLIVSDRYQTARSQGDLYNRLIDYGISLGSSNANFIHIRDIRYDNDIEGFKTYLQQQYAAGTPVTAWYVLATPETAVVNEPLRKIGTYADEVSGITIPTIAGANIIDVDTTLKPSEVSANYHGWHPVQSVHERESGAWD